MCDRDTAFRRLERPARCRVRQLENARRGRAEMSLQLLGPGRVRDDHRAGLRYPAAVLGVAQLPLVAGAQLGEPWLAQVLEVPHGEHVRKATGVVGPRRREPDELDAVRGERALECRARAQVPREAEQVVLEVANQPVQRTPGVRAPADPERAQIPLVLRAARVERERVPSPLARAQYLVVERALEHEPSALVRIELREHHSHPQSATAITWKSSAVTGPWRYAGMKPRTSKPDADSNPRISSTAKKRFSCASECRSQPPSLARSSISSYSTRITPRGSSRTVC